MRTRLGCIFVVIGLFGALFFGGVAVTAIMKGRAASDRVRCENNFRELGMFAALIQPEPGEADQLPMEILGRTAVPPGTVYNPLLPPDERLSWAVIALPYFDQKRQDTAGLLEGIDLKKAWNEGPHEALNRSPLRTLLCPGRPVLPEFDSPAITQYVGIAGVGADSPNLELGPPVPANAGCFRYDLDTPYHLISDGLGQTALFGEVSGKLGPWIQGGPSTIRWLDEAESALPPVGTKAQFGGNHSGGAVFSFADNSTRFLTDRISPAVLRAMFTMAAEDGGVDPGEL